VGEDLVAATLPVVRVDGPGGPALVARRRWLYRVTAVALGAIVAGALVDAAGILPLYGVDSRTVAARANGFELEVRYAVVSRPAVATPFDIEVRRPGGFQGPIVVAVSSDYLSMWDENGLDPAPARETASPGELRWEFEPPPSDALAISFDARIEPAAQQGKRGTVAVLDPSGAPLVSVSFRTHLRP
jgi:hypothetical protein